MARGMMGRQPVQATEEDADTATLDKPDEVNDLRTGQVSEGRLEIQREVARPLGWVPLEEWKRDPSKWTDADKFLENTPREIETLKERLKRTAQAAEAAIEDQRRIAREEAQTEIRAAAAAGDEDRASKAAERLANAASPPAHVNAWVERNPWMRTDPVAAQVAKAVSDRLAASGASHERQLEEAEAEVRRRFPEHFEPEEQPKEVRLSEARRAPPPVIERGARTAPTVSKDKGFADIPAGDRALYAKHFQRRYESTGRTPAEAQAIYARSYWSNKDG